MRSPFIQSAIGLLMFASPFASVANETTTDPITGLAIYNPKPEDCCNCVIVMAFDPVKQRDGTYKVSVGLSVLSVNQCEPVQLRSFKLIGPGTPSKNSIQGKRDFVDIIITEAEARAHRGKKWTFTVTCGPDATDTVGAPTYTGCSDTFEINLDSCEANTGGATPISESFTFRIPTTKSDGGITSGNIYFKAEKFENPGRSALVANMPANYVIDELNGIIRSINTGSTLILIEDAPPDVMALDPNAFTVTHKNTDGVVFRVTTISLVDENGISRFRMDSNFQGSTTRHEQTRLQEGTLIMERGKLVNGIFESLWQEILTKNTSIAGQRIYRRTIKERQSSFVAWENVEAISDIETTEQNIYIAGWVKTREVIDPDGDSLESIWEYYQPGEITGPNASQEGIGRLKRYVRYDGYETIHHYGLHYESTISPYAGGADVKITTDTWDPVNHTRTITETVSGNILSKTSSVHKEELLVESAMCAEGVTLTTTTHRIPSGQEFGGKPIRVIHPDGTLTTYNYSFTDSGGIQTIMDRGATTDNISVSSGIRTTTIDNVRGYTIFREAQAVGYGTLNIITERMAVTSVDVLGRPLVTAWFPESAVVSGGQVFATLPAWTTSAKYACCGLTEETDKYGNTTYHAYDHLQRQIKTHRLGVTTETHYLGLTTETHRYHETVAASLSPTLNGTNTTLVSRSVRNLAGTLQESWTPDPSSSEPEELVATTTETTYAPGTGLSSRTVTTVPGGHTQTTDTFLDGRTATTYGDLSPAMVYHYSVNETGELTTQAYLDGTAHREITGTQTDLAGRTVKTGRLSSLQSSVFESSVSMHYNSKGQLVRTVDPDGIVTLMAYNAKGERTTTATDLVPNTTYDDELNNIAYGTDTVQFSETVPALSGGNPVWQTTSKVWQNGQTDANGGTVVSTSLRSADGLSASSTSIGVANPSTSFTDLQGNGNWTTTQTNPDGTKQVQQYTAGRLVSSSFLNTENFTLANSSYLYDGLNRPTQTTDSRTGITTTEYMSATNDAVKSVTDPGNRKTEFVYDTRGRQIKTILPDSSETLTTYNPRGEVTGRSGSQTYPVTYTYDYAGRQKTMTTYGTEEATTTWIYDPSTGFLIEKNYSGENDDGVVDRDYTYTDAGRLLSRTWERGVTTTYGYDSGGRLISTTYSDNTPDVSITYDALGRQLTQSNGVAKSTFAYNAGNLQINTETIQYDLDPTTPGYEFTRILDRSQDTLGRDAGWKFGTLAQYNANWEDGNQNPDQENAVAYGYSTTDGRLATVAGASGSGIFQYGYAANSNLLATITGPIHTVTNTWDPTRNVLELKENKVGTLSISSFNYGVVDNTGGVNEIGQRTSVRTAGTAFSGASSWSWAYDPLGQITLAEHGTNPNFNRAYEYDAIGNRLKSADSLTLPTSNNYTPNALNQYEAVGAFTPSYDDDGNQIAAQVLPLGSSSLESCVFQWDAENRLISATIGTTTVTYTYDSQSRRIATQIGSTTTLVAYDGWNTIAEWSADLQSATLTKTYTWGMDMSGSMQGVGGVGGLLAVTIHNPQSSIYYPTYDGNGNVSEYLDSIGTIVAHYEYDPFGRVIVESGDLFASFAHRYSTKPQDLTTGLLYYGYRWYDPVTGRWPSRDPIDERGGINLYGFINNRTLYLIDVLGAYPHSTVVSCLSGNEIPSGLSLCSTGETGGIGGHNLETTGDASVLSVFLHGVKNFANSVAGVMWNNHAADYFTQISVLQLNPSIIDGLFNRPAGSLFQNYPDLRQELIDSGSANVDHRVTWFTSAREMTIGHINIDLKGELRCERNFSGRLIWKFRGSGTAEPDKFDFNQQFRDGVTSAYDIGIGILNVIQSVSSGWFYIKPLGEEDMSDYRGIISE